MILSSSSEVKSVFCISIITSFDLLYITIPLKLEAERNDAPKARRKKMMIKLTINTTDHQIDGSPDMPLLWAIRDIIGLKGTKFGCGAGLCGACTVHLNGEAVRSCQTPLADAANGTVVTIEHIGKTEVGAKVQSAWQNVDVPQCGYCQSGQIMSAAALLAGNSTPTDENINEAMSGNICRCGTYQRIRAAIHLAAAK